MAVKLSPVGNDAPFVDTNGNPYTGARLFFYVAGSSTKLDAYTDSSGNTAISNPVSLNSQGFPAVSGNVVGVWLTEGQTYDIGLAAPGSDDPPASFLRTYEDIVGINDPALLLASTFHLAGDITPASISGAQNNYNPSGFSSASILRMTLSGAATITGFSGGSDGRIICLILTGSGGNDLTLDDDSASSDVGNKITTAGNPGDDVILQQGGAVMLWYDSTSQVWRPIAAYYALGDDAAPGVLYVASKATQETGIQGTSAVVSSTQQHHKSAVKAWGNVAVSGGTPTLAEDYNIDSIADTNPGVLTVNIENDMSTTTYCAEATVIDNTAATETHCKVDSLAAGSFVIRAYNGDATDGVPADPDGYCFSVKGTLA